MVLIMHRWDGSRPEPRTGAGWGDLCVHSSPRALRELERSGLGHGRMRELCELLDSLDTSIHWDLRDDVQCLPARSARPAARIIESLAADIERLGCLIGRLDEGCPGHPFATAATIARAEISGYFRDIESLLGPIARAPQTVLPTAVNCRYAVAAAELPLLC